MKGDNLKKNSCMRDTVERERENGMGDTHKTTVDTVEAFKVLIHDLL